MGRTVERTIGNGGRTTEEMAKGVNQVDIHIHQEVGKTDEYNKFIVTGRTHTGVIGIDKHGTNT